MKLHLIYFSVLCLKTKYVQRAVFSFSAITQIKTPETKNQSIYSGLFLTILIYCFRTKYIFLNKSICIINNY